MTVGLMKEEGQMGTYETFYIPEKGGTLFWKFFIFVFDIQFFENIIVNGKEEKMKFILENLGFLPPKFNFSIIILQLGKKEKGDDFLKFSNFSPQRLNYSRLCEY